MLYSVLPQPFLFVTAKLGKWKLTTKLLIMDKGALKYEHNPSKRKK